MAGVEPDCARCAINAQACWARGVSKDAPLPATPPEEAYVGGRLRPGADLLIVAPHPEGERPFGHWTEEKALDDLRGALPVPRASLTYNVLCRYPDDPKKFEARIPSPRFSFAKRGVVSPRVACAARFDAEVAEHKHLALLGDLPIKAVFPGAPTADDVRGGPWPAPETDVPAHLRGKKVLGMFSPWQLREAPGNRPVQRTWAEKAARWFGGALRWQDPTYALNPSVEHLEALLALWEGRPGEGAAPTPWAAPHKLPIGSYLVSEQELDDVSKRGGFKGQRAKVAPPAPPGVDADLVVVAYDYEASGVEQATSAIRCLNLHDGVNTLTLLWRSVEACPPPGPERADQPVDCMTPAYEAFVADWCRRVFTSPRFVRAGWNSSGYDRGATAAMFGIEPTHEVDYMLLHKLCWPHWRHSLWWTGSTLTDVYPWKAEKAATEAKTTEVLLTYNARDGKVTWDAGRVLLRRVGRSGHGPRHVGLLEELQAAARGCRALGMRVDEARRLEHEAIQEERATGALEVIRQYDAGLNPRSYPQVARLLYDRLGLTCEVWTDTGAPSASDEAIRGLYGSELTPSEYLPLLRALRDYSRAQKVLNTFVRKFKAGTFEPATNQWVCDPTGIVRHEYLVTGTVGWRWASAGAFNAQNIPIFLRDMFLPSDPDCVFVYADQDALELRVAAGLAEAPRFLDVFENRTMDIHNLSGQLIFGEAYWQLAGAPLDRTLKLHPDDKDGITEFAQRRDLIKRMVYLAIYKGTAHALRGVLSEVEQFRDGKLVFPYGRVSEEYLTAVISKWLEQVPEIPLWWEKVISAFTQQGFVQDAIWGLRRWFPDGLVDREAINTVVQSTGCAMVHNAMLRVIREVVPFEGPEGLASQTHDALMFQVRRSRAAEVADALTDTMTCRYPHIPVTFTAKAKVRSHW